MRHETHPFNHFPTQNNQPITDVYKLVLHSTDANSGSTFWNSTYSVNLPLNQDLRNCKMWVQSWRYDPGLYVSGTTEATAQLEQMTHQVYSVYLNNVYLPNVYESGTTSTHLLTTRGFDYQGRHEEAVPINDYTVFRNAQLNIQVKESQVFAAQGGFAGLNFQNNQYTLILYIEVDQTS